MNLKSKTVCFTGHRNIPAEQLPAVTRRLEAAVAGLIERGYRFFGAGGALGFDTLAAQTVLRLKQAYPQIRLILVLPCLSQTKNWSGENKAVYEEIKARADKVVYTSQAYTRDCMLRRNRYLVDGSSVCVCYLTKPSGGTAYTVQYARANGLPVINTAHLPASRQL